MIAQNKFQDLCGLSREKFCNSQTDYYYGRMAIQRTSKFRQAKYEYVSESF